MKCVSCGKGPMVHETRDISYTYKAQTTSIPDVSGDYCSVCGESLHTEDEAEYLSSQMMAFAKEINGASVKPEFITDTRKLLKLDQRQAAEIFGGGHNAFSRYENGKTQPPLALVQLFKLLANHPELITELKPKDETTPAAKNKSIRRKKITV